MRSISVSCPCRDPSRHWQCLRRQLTGGTGWERRRQRGKALHWRPNPRLTTHTNGVNGSLSVCARVRGGVRLPHRSRIPVCIYTGRSRGVDLCGSQGMYIRYMASQSSRQLGFRRRSGRQSTAGERDTRARRRIRSPLHCEGTSSSPDAVSVWFFNLPDGLSSPVGIASKGSGSLVVAQPSWWPKGFVGANEEEYGAGS